MAINISVQYNDGLLLDIVLLTQGYYQQCYGEIKNELFFLRTRAEILLFEPPRT